MTKIARSGFAKILIAAKENVCGYFLYPNIAKKVIKRSPGEKKRATTLTGCTIRAVFLLFVPFVLNSQKNGL